MLFIFSSLIIGVSFGVLAGLVVLLNKKKFSPAVGIIAGASFLGGFLVSLTMFWFSMPVVGSIILSFLLIAGTLLLVLSRLYSRSFGKIGRSAQGIITIAIAGLMLFGAAYFSLSGMIWRGYDQAKYFDSIVSFPDEQLPFNHLINGDNVRVVDSDLAIEIIQKTQPFGSNSMIMEIHIGKIYGRLMWIGVMGSDAILIGTDNAGRKRNSIFGFVGVDLTDPSKEVIVVNQPFTIGSRLTRQKLLNRIIWKYNPNYRPGDNSYFSMNDEGEMRLLVPYSISKSWSFQAGLGMTTYLETLGGVLEFDAQGRLVKDYQDLSDLPDYARIQCYPEDWLEYNINKWGRHRKGEHEFAYWFTTTEQLGISWYDDIRVIYDANTEETSQYVMLTQPESESQLLRGAIKANVSGIYFFDWSELEPKPIDTLNAIYHSRTAIDVEVGTTEHNYRPILPLLFPIQETFGNMSDYAYVVPVQFGSIRFGGICITNPFDPSGVDTIVEFAETTDSVDDVLSRAIDSYLALMGITRPTEDNFTEILEITQLASFEQDGNTIILAQGNLTYVPEGNTTPISANKTVWFTQDFLNVTEWQLALFLHVGDTLELDIIIINDIIYCQEIVAIY